MDGSVLQSVCNAYETMYWDVESGRQAMQNQRDQAWATWTAKLGFPVMGIWPAEGDGSDINSVCACQVMRLCDAHAHTKTANSRAVFPSETWPSQGECSGNAARCEILASASTVSPPLPSSVYRLVSFSILYLKVECIM